MDYSSKEYFDKMTAWWRAANYLSVGQIYLKDNPLLRRTLKPEDVKKHPIGHWGTIPGQNFIYVHLNRIINKYDLNMFYIEGPGHGGQVMVSNAYLDGSYTEIYPEVTEDETGMQKLFKRFSFPGGIASHAAPETPGSIHEGGELGYSLSHGVGAVLDNPEVISAVVIGDGEAETGPLAGSWFSNVFINPAIDGAVLPILHLNGAKIANPTILARKSDPEKLNPVMAEKMDQAIEKIKSIQKEARLKTATDVVMPKWPVLIVRTPKGWTGPEEWDGEPIEGTFRAHQVPIPVDQEHMDHADALLRWLKSYEPEKLFDAQGRILEEIREIAPTGDQRMAKNPITNGGIDPKPLIMPDWKKYTLQFEQPGSVKAEDMTELGKFVREIIEKNPENFRIFGPDETKSNRLNQVFKTTNRQWMEKIEPENDEWLSSSGRVIDSQLSEHQDEGFLEGYVLTGRYGFFASYESFLRVVDSMLTQHFKWMRKSHDLSWRNEYPSLNLSASSTVCQQDHNGYSHQDPGILTHLAEKKAEFIREYLPADANTLLAVMDKAFRSSEKINLIISSKHPRAQFYSAEEAAVLVNEGLKIIDWASTAKEEEPELVIAAAGTESNLEALVAVTLLLEEFPKLKIRFINVVDLLKLRHPSQDPRGLSDEEFDQYFTKDKPILFAFHGYETLVRTIFFDRHNHHLMIHGYKENGDITTPFDMRVVNELDRYHLAKDAALKIKGSQAEDFAKKMDQKLQEHQNYIRENGIDLPEVLDWKWKNLDQ